MNDFIFLFDFPGALQNLRNVITICETTISEMNGKGEACPAKFGLGRECAVAMLSFQPVSRLVFRAMLDVIGGFYSAARTMQEIEPDDQALADAEELMEFARYLDSKAPPEFRLGVV